jgi:hypothetical protein
MLRTNKNMVNVLSNLITTMCHAFIQDRKLMPPHVNLVDSSSNEHHVKMSLILLKHNSSQFPLENHINNIKIEYCHLSTIT